MDQRDVESIQPLTPLQAAFMFHGARQDTDGGIDPGQLQARIELEGELNQQAFSAAWHSLLQQHPALRTSIHWRDLKQPLQLVHRHCDIDVHYQSGIDIDAFLHADRQRRFKLDQAPLQRVTVISSGPTRHTLCWSLHHIVLDGWSAAIVLDQLLCHYRAGIDGRAYRPPAVPPYRVWLKHIQTLDPDTTRAFWKRQLADASFDTRLWPASAGDSGFGMVSTRLSTDLSDRITRQARKLQTTTGLLMQALWAILLSRIKQTDRLVFGITVSGRSIALPGIESMIGLFVNALPLAVAISPARPIAELLRQLQQASAARIGHEHASLSELHRHGCIDGQHPFDSLLVVENFPWRDSAGEHDSLRIRSVGGEIAAHYPLTLVVIPGSPLQLKLHYRRGLLDHQRASKLLDQVEQLLTSLNQHPDTPVGQLRSAIKVDIPLLNTRPGAPAWLSRLTHRRRQPTADEPVETALLRLWRDTLRSADVGIDDSFFDLGGNSFLGLTLIDRINQLMGTRLPLLSLFQAPTVTKMAALLHSGFGRLPDTRLIPIQQKGGQPPLFMAYIGHWTASILASHLGRKQPFYILDSHWDQADIGPDESVERLAADCITDMRQVRKTGPWRVGGYSMGAVIAYEIARQLRADGEVVELLLLDPPIQPQSFANATELLQLLNSDNKPVDAAAADIGTRLARKRRQLANRSAAAQATAIIRETRELAAFLMKTQRERLHERVKKRITDPVRLGIARHYRRHKRLMPVAVRPTYVLDCYRSACKRYALHPYDGDMIIIAGRRYPDPSLWDRLAAPPARLLRLDGEHLDFLNSPQLIHRWAAEFAAIIEQRHADDDDQSTSNQGPAQQ